MVGTLRFAHPTAPPFVKHLYLNRHPEEREVRLE